MARNPPDPIPGDGSGLVLQRIASELTGLSPYRLGVLMHARRVRRAKVGFRFLVDLNDALAESRRPRFERRVHD
ncbi:hypothetical protein ACYOEI_36390 [Singulisphaera rosea]